LVVTFNFDNLLEMKLGALERAPKVKAVYQAARRTGEELPVVHVNGYLPKGEAIPGGGLVFAEDSFHKLTYSMFDWSSAEISECLRNYTVLFIGLSMSDPNLRRLLFATRVEQEQAAHIVMRKEHRLSADERVRLIEEVKRDARQEGARLNRDEQKDDDAISQAIDLMLEEAHAYDRNIFKSMGVGAMWFENFEDIPLILRAIPKHARKLRGR
jgi:hypothetical protein